MRSSGDALHDFTMLNLSSRSKSGGKHDHSVTLTSRSAMIAQHNSLISCNHQRLYNCHHRILFTGSVKIGNQLALVYLLFLWTLQNLYHHIGNCNTYPLSASIQQVWNLLSHHLLSNISKLCEPGYWATWMIHSWGLSQFNLLKLNWSAIIFYMVCSRRASFAYHVVFSSKAPVANFEILGTIIYVNSRWLAGWYSDDLILIRRAPPRLISIHVIIIVGIVIQLSRSLRRVWLNKAAKRYFEPKVAYFCCNQTIHRQNQCFPPLKFSAVIMI